MGVLRITVYCIQNILLEKFDFSLKIEVPLARFIRDRGLGIWDRGLGIGILGKMAIPTRVYLYLFIDLFRVDMRH